jgi:rhamnogalacturonyl hydrolase YesR
MEYMIVHRAGEIYKLRFKYETDELLYLEANTGIFYAIHGWEASKVMGWLEERNFKYYWERDGDD